MGIVFCVTTQTETQKHRICHVVWQDASHSEGHWVDLNDIASQDLPTIESAGFLVHEDDEKIIIAASVDTSNTQQTQTQTTTYISGEMIIPVAMILQFTHLDSAKVNR